ncbi:MAG: cation transporter [Salibacteraceae bacterium]
MKETVFEIAQMDCPSEEQLIRMKLADCSFIKHLDFKIQDRKLTVFHEGESHRILSLLKELKLGAKLIADVETKEINFNTDDSNKERKILWAVLSINFSFFLIEMLFGWFSKSMGLVADSLDMLADSIVYALSLLAVGQSLIRKKKVAKWSGYMQILLALLGLSEVIRRFIGSEEMPVFQTMIIVSILALIANAMSLYLIQKANSKEAHMQASEIFTSNDIIINIGVILAGMMVYLTNNQYPDLLIGAIVFAIVIRGAIRILKLSK